MAMTEEKVAYYLPAFGISCVRICCAACRTVLELPPKAVEAAMAKHNYSCVSCGKPLGLAKDNPVVMLAEALVKLESIDQQVKVELPVAKKE